MLNLNILHTQNLLYDIGYVSAKKKLEEKLGITVKEYENIIILNYSQINSPKFDPIVRECRSLILNKYTYSILSRSFDRFYNYKEEPNAPEINFKTTTCIEKIDGSLINFWFDPFKRSWEVSTRKMAYAEGTSALGNSFRSIIHRIIKCDINDMMRNIPIHWTCTFELVSPETRVVKSYTEEMLYLINIRCNATGSECHKFDLLTLSSVFSKNIIDFSHNKCSPIKLPTFYKFDSINQINKNILSLPPMDEGYVCTDYSLEKSVNYRVKIKNPEYVALSLMRANGCLTPKRILYIVFKHEDDEYLKYFAEDEHIIKPYINARELFYTELYDVYCKIKHITNRKEYAKESNKYEHLNTMLFYLIDNPVNTKSELKYIIHTLIFSDINTPKFGLMFKFLRKYLLEQGIECDKIT